MTLSSLLLHNSPATPNYENPPVTDVDRTHWGGGGGGWKGGKGNPNAALSALTLLAFLFFLNILQSCLKDSIGQKNGMFVMVLPANATAASRLKREIAIESGSREEDSLAARHQNLTDLDVITNLVHTQVESYWSSERKKAKKYPLNSVQLKSKRHENNINLSDLKRTVQKRISTKLYLNKNDDIDSTLDGLKMAKNKIESLKVKNNITDTGLKTVKNEHNQTRNKFWTNEISFFIKNAIPHMRKMICCSNIFCEKEHNLPSTHGTSRDSIFRNTKTWFCKSIQPAVCVFYPSSCQN